MAQANTANIGIRVGYARTSTTEQVAGFDAQIVDLTAAGCEKVYREQISSLSKREQLEALIDYIRGGDIVVVTKLDRLARSMRDLIEIITRIDAKGASLRILAMNLDTSTSTGKLMLNVLGSVAQFEREMMLERQREGIKAAQVAGKYKGRAPKARNQADEIETMRARGFTAKEIAETLGIAARSVYRFSRKPARNILPAGEV